MSNSKFKPFLVQSSIIKKYTSSLDVTTLAQLSYLNRIHCLAGLKCSNHGWLGASFSAMEILTTIYSLYVKDPGLPISQRPSVILSKGHSVMALYSVLRSLDCIDDLALTSYKSLNGLPAHCDSQSMGIDSDSGSLGQGLSKAIGVAIRNRHLGNNHPVFVLIGDGELQEGQLFEAFLTLNKFNLVNCIPIIDRNLLQSDSQTADIKDAQDWAKVFEGVGLEVDTINGHNISEINQAIEKRLNSKSAGLIIANTVKGYGSKITAMGGNSKRRTAIWHGKIPNHNEYISILNELVDKIGSNELGCELKLYEKNFPKNDSVNTQPEFKSTAIGFSEALIEAAENYPDLFFLDADLEKSCKLTDLAIKFPERFLEIGISEQDMCSIANGIGINGGVSVVNTYASFYKRAVDQIFACVTEHVPVIFAGHYAGVDYFTDGKSHQSVNDVGIFRALGKIKIFEPLTPEQAKICLLKCLEEFKELVNKNEKATPVYIRLHRTPINIPEISYNEEINTLDNIEFNNEEKADYLLITSGPHMLRTALDAQEVLNEESIHLDVKAIIEISQKMNFDLTGYNKVFCLEDNMRDSGIGAAISLMSEKKIVRIGVSNYYQSTRNFDDMKKQHSLNLESVCEIIQKAVKCKSH